MTARIAALLFSRLFLVEKSLPSLERVFEGNWSLSRGYIAQAY